MEIHGKVNSRVTSKSCDVSKAMKIIAQQDEYAKSLAESYLTSMTTLSSALSTMVTQLYGACANGCTMSYPSQTYSMISQINADAETDAESLESHQASLSKALKAAIAGCNPSRPVD